MNIFKHINVNNKITAFIILGTICCPSVFYYSLKHYSMLQFLMDTPDFIPFIFGTLISICFLVSLGFFIRLSPLGKEKQNKENYFTNIDKRGRHEANTSTSTADILNKIKNLESSHSQIDYEKIEQIFTEATKEKNLNINVDNLKDFRAYFKSIVSTLEHKSNIADEKASMLLDKGTAYSKGGIIFFSFQSSPGNGYFWTQTLRRNIFTEFFHVLYFLLSSSF